MHFNYQRFIKLHLELPGNPRAGGAEMFPEEKPGGPGGAGTEINPGTFPKFWAGWDAVVGFFWLPSKVSRVGAFQPASEKLQGCIAVSSQKKKTPKNRIQVERKISRAFPFYRSTSVPHPGFFPIFLQG